jgi:hypothetical protein
VRGYAGWSPQLLLDSILSASSLDTFIYMFIYLAKMLCSKFLLAFVLQWSLVLSQVYFTQPSAGEIIMGGVPFIVSLPDSFSAPYFSQMTNFSLLLLAGNYSSPVSTLSPSKYQPHIPKYFIKHKTPSYVHLNFGLTYSSSRHSTLGIYPPHHRILSLIPSLSRHPLGQTRQITS